MVPILLTKISATISKREIEFYLLDNVAVDKQRISPWIRDTHASENYIIAIIR